MDLCMTKAHVPMSTHLSEFNSIFRQVVSLKFVTDDKFKATFYICTLPKSWDVFWTAMSLSNGCFHMLM